MNARQFWMGIATTLAIGCIAWGLLLLTGCAPANTRLARADLTPAQLTQPIVLETLAAQELADRKNAEHMWSCTKFDFGTTAVGLAIGLAEANPLGILIVPLAFAINHQARENAKRGDPNMETVATVSHCGAGALNVLTIAAAL